MGTIHGAFKSTDAMKKTDNVQQRSVAEGVLPLTPGVELDSLAELAACLCDLPVAVVSLFGPYRQWSRVFCRSPEMAAFHPDLVALSDALQSPRLGQVQNLLMNPDFALHPLVAGSPSLRFYAGIPLVLPSGEHIGSLSIFGRKPGRLSLRRRTALGNLVALAVPLLQTWLAAPAALSERDSAQVPALQDHGSYEATPAMLFVMDPQGHVCHASEHLLRKLGYRREQVVGAYVGDFMSMRSKVRMIETLFPRLIEQGRLENEPLQLVSAPGSIFEVLLSVTLERDAAGTPLRALSYVEDVTLRLQTERKLAEERKHLLNIVNGTSAGTWELDLITGQDIINETYAQMLGYSVPEMTRQLAGDFFNIVHPEDHEHVSVQWNAHLSGMTTEYEAEFRVQHREGHWVWILSRGKVGARDPGGRALHISGIHLDISARRSAIDMATRAAHDLQNTLDALPSRVVYWDKELRYRFGNRAFCKRFARPGLDLTGKSMRELLGDDLYAQNVAAIRGMEDGTERQFERSAVRENGELEHYIIRYLPDMMDGRVQGYYVFVFDITEIKAAQAQLETLNGELAERTAQAEAASVSKSAFLASMSHEIRTPMNAILGMHSLIQKTSLTPRQLDYLKKSERAAKSLLGLLNDILDYSKVEAGKLSLDPQPFRTDDLLDELSVIFSAYVGNKPVEVLFDVGAGLPEVLLGDALRIKQVLINLGGNAIKFTEQGSVVICMVWDGADSAGSKIRFLVKDSGIGIALENQSHIFDGFSQAEASTTRKFGGTGLGLAISKRLVELMGGAIHLESALGIGSVFSFELNLPPVRDIPESLKKAHAPPHAVHRVLVIDDHQLSGELLRIAGRSLSWDVELCSSGVKGIERMIRVMNDPAQAFDLVLIDWQMPEMDGWETARHLREVTRAAPRQPLLLMVSANSMEMVSHRTDEEQALLDGFLSKPVTPAMLSSAVAAASSADPNDPQAVQTASLRRLAGMHILVVEDNLINQQVAEELLLSEGARVSLAANGEQGVQAIRSAAPPYHAVLMDIQMPVMDGHTATRIIRQDFKPEQLPIIGLTANALLSDRADCLASGMNAHVGKPFEMEHLVAVLLQLTGFKPKPPNALRYFGADGVPRTAGQASTAGPLDGGGLITADIDLPAALQRMSGMTPMYLRAAREFHKMLGALLPGLDRILVSADMKAAATHLHTYKGTAGTVGLTRLAKELTRLEQMCNAGAAVHEVAQHSVALGTTVKMAMKALEAAASSLGKPIDAAVTATAAGTEPPHGAVVPLDSHASMALEEIARLAAAGDLEVLQYFAEARSRLITLGEQRLGGLEEALQALDLDTAAQICRDSVKAF